MDAESRSHQGGQDSARGDGGALAALRRGLPRMVQAAVLPAAIFSFVVSRWGVEVAIGVSLAYAYGLALYQRARTGYATAMVSVSCVLLGIRAVAGLASGSGQMFFGLAVLETVAVGAMFVLSLCSETPLVVKMVRDFAPEGAARLVSAEHRALVRRVSVIWGIVHLGIAATTAWLLMHESLAAFVWLKELSSLAWMGAGAVVTGVLLRPVVVARPAPATV
ncbi:MAG: hypothetical protein JOZ04_08380 [Acidimicrobiia bacterium]|nr:hypothetical protein [Acidimicrobiia bacterium]